VGLSFISAGTLDDKILVRFFFDQNSILNFIRRSNLILISLRA
jgi:hypothetical protein